MFTSFSGNSRRPRQVNLSGRNAPLPSPASTRPSNRQSGASGSLALAQHERLLRQQERDRVVSVNKLQRLWRGCSSRLSYKSKWRAEWDLRNSSSAAAGNAGVVGDSLEQLRLLIHFADLKRSDDVQRWQTQVQQICAGAENGNLDLNQQSWKYPLFRLEKLCLAVLAVAGGISREHDETALSMLAFLAHVIPEEIAQGADDYFRSMSTFIVDRGLAFDGQRLDKKLLHTAVLAPIQALTSQTLSAYHGFAWHFLTIPDLPTIFSGFPSLAASVNSKLFTASLALTLRESSRSYSLKLGSEEILWLLAYFIYLRASNENGGESSQNTVDPDYVFVISTLLSSLAAEVSSRIELEDVVMNESPESSDDEDSQVMSSQKKLPLPPFVRQQILSLVNQKSVSSLLANADSVSVITAPDDVQAASQRVSQTRALATYALTLLRIFPRRGDEIRMWLYLGSTSSLPDSSLPDQRRIPAVKHFWRACRKTKVFTLISRNARNAIGLLQPATLSESRSPFIRQSQIDRDETDQEWKTVLIFFELYSFVLKVMDDDEFFSHGGQLPLRQADRGSSSWTRESALPLEDVQELTVFLKNLGFTLYWDMSRFSSVSEESVDGIGHYFGGSPRQRAQEQPAADRCVAGVPGMTLDYIKGIVTGLLRMVYERDSRRRFLPKDHWLMAGTFGADGFIPAVVAEEENRHQVQEAEDEDEEGDIEMDSHEDDAAGGSRLIGTQRTQRTRAQEALRRQQRKASRRRYLEAVTPRLEILQNMPFFIPFETRVQIFRDFVALDQRRRRNGHVDPDTWRMSVLQSQTALRDQQGPSAHSIIAKHHANIRRGSVLQDAFDQFYQLGDGLKEPIQITFIDRFGTVEAGIDGGGVTKEFLTSITDEALNPAHGLRLFVENDQHLLHPNPTSVEECKAQLRQRQVKEGSPEWNEKIRELLQQYEFVGRVIGKCLYEEILVDIGFIGFFLLKWALTGGAGAASRESGYRANLNDLRDLDEGLYQGLLQLKNYTGNVEDFALDFTVTDTVFGDEDVAASSSKPAMHTITRELKPNGSNIPVTNENRLVYISYMARHRLQVQPYLQTNAFLRGLSQIIQPSWLSMFNQTELQTLVGGASSEIDVSDLRKNTLYGGVYAIGDDGLEHPSVQLFWEVMSSFSDVNRRKVLKFITSTPRAPLLGFAQLNPHFSIRDAGADETRLPSTSTCVNLLKLPRYTQAKTLEQKLLYAVNSGAGFDLS
ncbi:MAG: hypothetical protein M1825_000118 [Sarcosagium campestre]|nr:MAG: hypothetical protein M1825_000118 [Sarcosagium campestre]